MTTAKISPFASPPLPAYQRADILNTLVRLLRRDAKVLIQLISSEVSKPITLAQRELERAQGVFAEAAAESLRWGGSWLPADVQATTHQVFSKPLPLGPLLAITPFNYPLNLAVHKIAPAMALGIPFVLKPSPRAPGTAQKLLALVHEAGYPQASAQLLLCSNEQALDWVRDPRFAILSFTGSAAVGWALKKESNAKQVLLELGGNASVILAPDSAWKEALPKIVWGAFMFAGQVCISVQQLWVHESFYDACVSELLQATAQVKAGDPMQPETVVSPMIDEAAAQRVEAWINQAQGQGASVLLRGLRHGRTLSPTVLSDVPLDQPLCCEEVFGPVLVLHRYKQLSQVYQRINEFRYGLHASIYTQALATAFDAFESLQMGSVLVNEIPTFRLDSMPYGGSKDSGLGREGVRYAMAAYCEPKNLILQPKFPGA